MELLEEISKIFKVSPNKCKIKKISNRNYKLFVYGYKFTEAIGTKNTHYRTGYYDLEFQITDLHTIECISKGSYTQYTSHRYNMYHLEKLFESATESDIEACLDVEN